ncbi:MAG: tetratricopeptide repeat protein [Kofleriaceae bacterium]
MSDPVDQLITLGREHYKAGEYDKAEPLLAQAVAAEPRYADVYNMLGVIYHAHGRFQDAEAAFEAALAINPNYTEAALNLSVTYNDRGKYDRAREVYSRAVTASYQAPRNIDPFARGKLANMHADLGAGYASLAMYAEAVREYGNALALCPEFADLRVQLGAVYRDMGDHAAAIRELTTARDQRPEYMPAQVHLGVAYFSAGRKDDAVATWRAVLAHDPANKSAALYLRMMKD